MNSSTLKSFFLVEDEALIRMMLADMIEQLGNQLAAEAGSLGEALPLARNAIFDIAILDINLGGSSNSAPVAEVYREQRHSVPVCKWLRRRRNTRYVQESASVAQAILMEQIEEAIEAALTKT